MVSFVRLMAIFDFKTTIKTIQKGFQALNNSVSLFPLFRRSDLKKQRSSESPDSPVLVGTETGQDRGSRI